MTHGIDTDFLVALEIRDHPFHAPAHALLRSLLKAGHDLAVAPQLLAEFIHVATDPRRMPHPLKMNEAISRAEFWWEAAEVRRVFPDGSCVTDFLNWLNKYELGRKRLLDTLLATTYQAAGIRKLISNNEADFRVFGCFELVSFQ